MEATLSQFNRFYNEFDKNGDGVITKDEMYDFVKNFIEVSPESTYYP